jgi:pimeloyl-ACP methyl ester carboxylesterase
LLPAEGSPVLDQTNSPQLAALGCAGLQLGQNAPDALPVLALHGWLDNAASFVPLGACLADTECLWALDLPGHGRASHRAPGTRYLLFDFVEWLDGVVERVVAHTGHAQVRLLGHSMGGAIASVYAAARPERVATLVLIEALGPISYPASAQLAQLRQGLDAGREFANKQRRVFAAAELAIQTRLVATPMPASAAELIVRRGLETVDGGYRWSSDPALTLSSMYRLDETQVRAILAGLAAPTLLIEADPSSSWFNHAAMRERLLHIPKLQHQRLAGGHHVHMECPAEVAALLREFWASGERALLCNGKEK